MDDLLDALGVTTRSVSTVELDGRPARRTLVSRTYATDPDDLWDALTRPERIPRWFLPVTGDLREGGHYQLEGNAGGTVEQCEPPRRFRVTWVMGDGGPTWLTVTLSAAGQGSPQGTRLDLEHVGVVPAELWEQFGPGATGIGWDLTLHGLALHLGSGATVDPQAAAAWSASDEGLAFLQRSGDAWRDADVEAGTSPAEAAVRAARTLAAYTGRPVPDQPGGPTGPDEPGEPTGPDEPGEPTGPTGP